ncbi:MAG: DUF523 domain-containing protein [Spirochaetia bacterium]|nr:DUF523 domain-containing protein [Spirochaetia bacterium]
MNRPSLLVSACLFGYACRYNESCVAFKESSWIEKQYTLIKVCPEQLGGLPTPRNPAEIQGARVVDAQGNDLTDAFELGAKRALALAREHRCTTALLMDRSPSCGYHQIYDGTFSSTLIEGSGIFAQLLKKQGFTIYTPETVTLLLADTHSLVSEPL